MSRASWAIATSAWYQSALRSERRSASPAPAPASSSPSWSTRMPSRVPPPGEAGDEPLGERPDAGVVVVPQRLAPPREALARAAVGGRGLARGEVGALERSLPPALEPLALAVLERGDALGQRARRRHAEAFLGRQRPEQVLLARGHDVQRPARRERGLDVAGHQR